jgi:hypothetical protein
MVTLPLAGLLAAQATPASGAVARLNCRAVAVNGARLDFPLEPRGSEEEGEARVPRCDAPFVRAADRRFMMRGLPDALGFRLMNQPGRLGATRSGSDHAYAICAIRLGRRG